MLSVKAKGVHQGRRLRRRRHVGHRVREQERGIQRLLPVRAKRVAAGAAGQPGGGGQELPVDVRATVGAWRTRGRGRRRKMTYRAVAEQRDVQRAQRGEQLPNEKVAASDSYCAGIATGVSRVGTPGALLALIPFHGSWGHGLLGQQGVPGHRVPRADRGRGAQDRRARVLRRRRCPAGHSCGRGAAGCTFYLRVGRRKRHEGRIHMRA